MRDGVFTGFLTGFSAQSARERITINKCTIHVILQFRISLTLKLLGGLSRNTDRLCGNVSLQCGGLSQRVIRFISALKLQSVKSDRDTSANILGSEDTAGGKCCVHIVISNNAVELTARDNSVSGAVVLLVLGSHAGDGQVDRIDGHLSRQGLGGVAGAGNGRGHIVGTGISLGLRVGDLRALREVASNT